MAGGAEGSDADAIRRGLLQRLMILGALSILTFLVGYAIAGLRYLVWVEAAFLVEVLVGIVLLRRGWASVQSVAFVLSISVFAVIAGNTIVLGGFLPSAGFAVWAYMPPLAGLFLLDGAARRLLVAGTAAFLVGVLALEPYLQPIEALPVDHLRTFFFLNISGSLIVVLGSIDYVYSLLLGERRAVLEASRRHRLTLEQLPVAIALKDSAGHYQFVNGAFERTFAVTRAELAEKGDRLWEVADAERLRRLDAAALAEDQTLEGDEPFWVRGERRVLRSARLRLIDEAGRPVICWMVNDVTDHLRAERSLQNERHLEALGTLAGGIAHDFNNLLMAISGNIELVAMGEHPPKTARRLSEAERAVDRARALTQQILTFARGGAPQRSRTSLSSLLHESASFALMGTSTRLALSVQDGLPSVEADAGQLGRVIHNLVLNATQAMPQGGLVQVRARELGGEALPDGLRADLSYIRIDVQDQGPGIAPELMQRVFDPFFTTRPRGSGLGLTTSHSIVRQHEGALVLASTLGKGTIATVYLPVAEGETEEVEVRPRRLESGSAVRILLMDDDDTVRELLVDLLRSLGHQVESCADGAVAIERYLDAQRIREPFDLVFLDLTVPGGMGGVQAGEQILEIDPRARLIAASGYAEDTVRAELLACGFQEALKKPFTLAEVQRAIAEVMAGG